ncbi:MAG: hypothetical protein K2H96_08540 [Muribaculaceae bacterium]|nr:hypothetical protein [Muribaculaceae bacterium]
MKRLVRTFVVALTVGFAGGCAHKPLDSGTEGNVLVSVGDSSLNLEDVERLIPAGLTSEDSVEMLHSIIDHWIETRVLEEVARENVIDLEEIDRLTQNYRNRLIVDEYLRKMGENAPSDVNRSEVENYYRQFGDSLRLEQPILKGIYLRTSERDPQLDNIRRWLSSGSEVEIDELEKRGLREATGYEYFTDRWVAWEDVARQMPVRVEDADLFLKENRDFDTVRGGSVYLLHVTDYIPSGEVMPKEFALARISEILADRRVGEYRKNLKKSIYRKALKEGRLKKGSYDPFESL